MNERPILFSGPMVRAILDGRKTQTRRVIRPNPYDGAFYVLDGWPHRSTDGQGNRALGMEEPYRSPYGGPGDRLWVRETWAPILTYCDEDADGWAIEYAAGGTRRELSPPFEWREREWAKGAREVGRRYDWRPSIYMPRWASRLSLDLTAIRVERLQDITAEDARSEGIEVPRCQCEVCARSPATICPADASEYIGAFRALWDSINGERQGASWAANPWVWVIGFRAADR